VSDEDDWFLGLAAQEKSVVNDGHPLTPRYRGSWHQAGGDP
jgi:hypothetical protein